MSDVLMAVAAIITAIGVILMAYWAFRAKENAAAARYEASAAKNIAADAKAEIILTKEGVFELGKAVDGRFTKLIKTIEEAEFAKGKLAGKAEQKAETDAAGVPEEMPR